MTFWPIEFPAMVAALLAAAACGLVGNLLVLRREAMLGDAISHMVLPGLVLAAWIGSQLWGHMWRPFNFLGAVLAAVLGVALLRWLERRQGAEPRAAMGFVFTAFFALGVILLEITGQSNRHLDVEHALFGSLETLIWIDLFSWQDLARTASYATMPSALASLSLSLLVALIYFAVNRRRLMVWLFDPDYSQTSGLALRGMEMSSGLMVAFVAMAAFEAVGAVLVVALLVAPAAAAHLFARRFSAQLMASVLLALAMAVLGLWMADAPLRFGWLSDTLPASGAIAFAAGLVFTLTLLFGALKRRLRPTLGNRRPLKS